MHFLHSDFDCASVSQDAGRISIIWKARFLVSLDATPRLSSHRPRCRLRTSETRGHGPGCLCPIITSPDVEDTPVHPDVILIPCRRLSLSRSSTALRRITAPTHSHASRLLWPRIRREARQLPACGHGDKVTCPGSCRGPLYRQKLWWGRRK